MNTLSYIDITNQSDNRRKLLWLYILLKDFKPGTFVGVIHKDALNLSDEQLKQKIQEVLNTL